MKICPAKKNAGFTLVELLVVVSIIGALAALVLPSLAACRRQAWAAACESNLHEIGIASQIYEDQEGRFPLLELYRDGYEPLYWEQALLAGQAHGVFECPDFMHLPRYTAYGYGYLEPAKQVANPSSTILCGDAAIVPNYSDPILFACAVNMNDGPRLVESFCHPTAQTDPEEVKAGQAMLQRHGGRVNFLFCDGSVRRLELFAGFEQISGSRTEKICQKIVRFPEDPLKTSAGMVRAAGFEPAAMAVRHTPQNRPAGR